MTLSDIAQIRLKNQQITKSEYKSAKDIVSWMGAMQAQDYLMSKWAIGVRLPKTTDKEIHKAISDGDIIRTHVLRPTWHLIVPEDIHWMLSLTAPQVKKLMKTHDKQLEITDELYTKSHNIIEKALSNGEHLTREELVTLLEKEHIKTNDNRSSHLLMRAELDTIICSGEIKNNKHTYTLLAGRVHHHHHPFSREEALAKLAQKYFLSHGPATLQDFAWWSGLSQKDAKTGLESIKSELISVTAESKTYWLKDISSQLIHENHKVHLLPAFDEFIISYKDRSATLSIDHHKRAVSTNGIFRPTIVVDSQVIGLWRKTTLKNKVTIETDFFHKQDPHIIESIEQAIGEYGHFLNKEIERV